LINDDGKETVIHDGPKRRVGAVMEKMQAKASK